jgi:uncharacterized oxidoreductase
VKLEGNTVLITGGTRGIGLALAQAFVACGSRVIIAGRDRQRLDRVRRELAGVETRFLDLADASGLEEFAHGLRQDVPGLNILVNNAGMQGKPDFRNGADVHSIRNEIETNLTSHIAMTAFLLPGMLARPAGAVVNITSALAIAPKRSAPVYCASKAAMRTFTRALRYQLEDTPVKVFEVMPALVQTAMTADRAGRHMIGPDAVARAALAGMAADRYEIAVERARLLRALHRLWPGIAYRILRNE